MTLGLIVIRTLVKIHPMFFRPISLIIEHPSELARSPEKQLLKNQKPNSLAESKYFKEKGCLKEVKKHR